MNYNLLIAQRIKKVRTEKAFTQKYIAEALSLTENAYSRIENGHTQLTINNLFIIAQRLELSINELLSVADSTVVNNNSSLVMNNVNHGSLNINLTPEEFQYFYNAMVEKK